MLLMPRAARASATTPRGSASRGQPYGELAVDEESLEVDDDEEQQAATAIQSAWIAFHAWSSLSLPPGVLPFPCFYSPLPASRNPPLPPPLPSIDQSLL